MTRKIFWFSTVAAIIFSCLMCSGCDRGDIRAEFVIKGQPAPFDGYTISPEIYSTKDTPVPMSGVHVWITGLDPNDLFSE
jgi:hypothetical protein